MKWIATLALICATPAMADGVINGVPVDCYCTDKQGQRIEVGETICLQVDGRMFMAQCQMSLNVPMWRKIQDGCLSASPSHRSDPTVDTVLVHTQI